MTETLLNGSGQALGRKLIWGLPEIFSWLDWGDGYFGAVAQTWSAQTGDINLDPLVKVVFARLFRCEVTICPFPYFLESSQQV